MRACDWDEDWWRDYLAEGASGYVPELTVELADPDDEPPRLLGPDGYPAVRMAHKFGFQPRMVED